MEEYNLFSKKYEKLFDEGVKSFCSNVLKKQPAFAKKKYDVFYPSCGSFNKDDIQFMFYGQATNGWDQNNSLLPLNNTFQLQKAIECSNTLDDKEYISPLHWINRYWSKYKLANFFFPVAYITINTYRFNKPELHLKDFKNLYVDDLSWMNDDTWCRHLVWSNLAKIAPHKGRNPNDKEWELQSEISKQLFDKEIEEIHPPYVILLTNWETWAKYYLTGDKYVMKEIKNKEMLEAVGFPKFNPEMKIIVVKRQHYEKSYKKWITATNEILKIIRNA